MHKKRRETASRPAEMFGRHEACVRLPVRRGRGRRAAGAGTRLPVPDAARALAAPSTARLSGHVQVPCGRLSFFLPESRPPLLTGAKGQPRARPQASGIKY